MATEQRPPPHVRRGVATGFLVAVTCGLGGAFVGEEVVGTIARVVGHRELVLRGLGWCWGGLPFVLAMVALLAQRRIAARAKPVVTTVLVVWAASGALLIPGRGSDLEGRFESAYPEARLIGFGWAAGFLSVVLVGAALVVGVLVVQKVFGARGGTAFAWFIGVVGAAVIGAGLAAALVAPVF
ncbi:hypothetical protein [Kribbella flavida]|uniref:hypothetical protein n=1 Tax=Kribbella flavida TaxID=182640 RepID=UPI00019BD9D2|nr:hypothetical protein [Kribbella flavida]